MKRVNSRNCSRSHDGTLSFKLCVFDAQNAFIPVWINLARMAKGISMTKMNISVRNKATKQIYSRKSANEQERW